MRASSSTSLLFFLSLTCYLSLSTAQATPPLVSGLSYTFYRNNCPSLETTIRDYLRDIFNNDVGMAPALLRLHFHDCFVQGCDGSVLLDGSASGPGEQNAPPNRNLRARAFVIINQLRDHVHTACGPIVSCSDITALSAREAVSQMGGPNYSVPLGRRDGLNWAGLNETLSNLPPPNYNTSQLIGVLGGLGFDVNDLVALSGGHTYGRSNCASFVGRLYPNLDPTLNTSFANNLTSLCPTSNSTGVTDLDVLTPNRFDNAYYIDLVNGQGLLNSDQTLFTDAATKPIVQSFADNQTLFYERFAYSMVKMSMMSVLTGTQGEIRTNCSRTNAASTYLTSLVDGQGKSAAV